MSCHFFETTPDEQHYLSQHLPGETLRFHSEPLTRVAQVAEDADYLEILSPFVHSRLNADIINSLPNLKLIATRSTGYDHIAMPEAGERGLLVCNVPNYGDNTVAEHTFALILALSRNLHKAQMQAVAGNFSLEGLQGFDLKGKMLGVVGVGHIGEYVMRLAKAFGMHLLAYDPVQDRTKAEHFGFTYTSLEDLLGQSDIVTLHAPASSATYHLIGSHNIQQFKRGALLINTARGEMVDTEALVQALNEGILRGAGLDVLEGEETVSKEKQSLLNRSLLHRPDLILTPHIAFDSAEAVERILETTVANIKAFRSGRPQNQVNQ